MVFFGVGSVNSGLGQTLNRLPLPHVSCNLLSFHSLFYPTAVLLLRSPLQSVDFVVGLTTKRFLIVIFLYAPLALVYVLLRFYPDD